MEFCKYEMTDLQWSNLKKKIEITNENTSFIGCAVVELGYIVLTPAVMEGMAIKTPAILSNKFSVDILWNELPLTDFKKYEVFPAPCGVHSFSGLQSLYAEKYYTKYPELKLVTSYDN
ncbi:MAG: hypothetical protein ACOYMA_17695 [Bacteroidia bacterium]